MKSNQIMTKTQRIPLPLLKKITKIGNGSFRAGLYRMDEIYELVNRDPSILLQRELEHFGGLIHAFASENHYSHYVESNMPAVLHKFIKTGRVDHTILNTRRETPIDKFNKEEDSDD